MEIESVSLKGSWRDVADSARTTVGKTKGEKEPSSSWKKKMLLAEHSPIRHLIFSWKWLNLKYWVSVHFVRHKFGIEHFVRTQRTDRTGKDRNKASQDSFVEHGCLANAQAIINISRKRLCSQASPETRQAWKSVLKNLKEPELISVCVPDCIYRGHCYEINPCGYSKTEKYKEALINYRNTI
jgi:hypothetical protein